MSGTTTAGPSGERPQLLSTLINDIHVVVNDIMRRGIRRSVRGTLSSLEQFYLSREERQRLAELRGFRRFVRRIGWFTRGLLMKLTPARRIMLAVAFLSLFLGMFNITVDSRHVTLRFQSQGTVLLPAVLVLELKDKLIARDELQAGRAVQLALMPTDQPQVPGWDIWLYTKPANDVGGDLVDHLPLDDNRHAVVLGDVTGKALPAALLSVKLQATIRALAPNYGNLADLGSGLNRILYRDGLPTRFASLIYAVLSPDSGDVQLLNAGHMPPLVLRGRTLTTMPRGSMVLGMMPNVPFAEQQHTFAEGDLIVVYSDGVSEAMNEAEDFFGDERLEMLVVETGGMSAQDAGTHILASLSSFVGDAVQSDDVSLLVLRRTAPPARQS
jgi:phosphoserine phosphatase RsbU/P